MAGASRSIAWNLLGVVALTALAFWPVRGHTLVDWDDRVLLVDTTAYRELWWPAIRHAFTSTTLGHYVPLTWLSFSVDVAIWGPGFQGFHATNLVLHALNAVLLYAVGRVVLRRASTLTDPALGVGAACGALFFAVHPMRAETVAWLTERRGVLSASFALLSVLAYLRAAGGGRGRRWALGGSVAAFLLALLAKESTLVLPLGLVILDVYPLRRLPPPGRGWLARAARPVWLEKLPHFGLAAAGGLVAHRVAGAMAVPLEPSAWLALVPQGLWYHVQKELIPLRLSPLVELSGIELRHSTTIVSAMGVLAVTLALFWLRRRWPAGVAAWIWYVMAIVPFMGLAHAGPQLTADRYSYLASWGWALALGGAMGIAVRAAARGHARPRALVAAGALAILTLTWLTNQQARIWESAGTLWLHATAVAPHCRMCRYNLGVWLVDHGQASAALAHFDELRSRYPAVPKYEAATGVALSGLGRYRDAEPHYRRAVRGLRGADEAVMRLNLAGVLIEEQRLAEGIGELRRALDVWPPDAARAHLERGIAVTPRKPVLRLALAELYRRQGEPAREAAERAVLTELHPDLARLAASMTDGVPAR